MKKQFTIVILSLLGSSFNSLIAQKLLEQGINATGFYDDFINEDIIVNDLLNLSLQTYLYQNDKNVYQISRDSGLHILTNQPTESYDEIIFYIGNDTQTSIDLSGEIKVSTIITNNSTDTVRIRFSLQDIDGNIATFYPEGKDDPNGPWLHFIEFTINPQEKRDIVLDITNVPGYDFNTFEFGLIDLTKIKSAQLMILGNNIGNAQENLENTYITLSKLHIGQNSEDERNILLSSTEPIIDTIIEIVDTVVVIKEPIDTTPKPLLTSAGINNYGFYDDFINDNSITNDSLELSLNMYVTEGEKNVYQISKDSGLHIVANQNQASYEPIFFDFRRADSTFTTIDLSRETKLSTIVTNNSTDTVKIRFSFVDIDGKIADIYPTALEDPENPWLYFIEIIINPQEKREVILDITDALYYDLPPSISEKADLSKTTLVLITLLGNNFLSEGNPGYQALENTSITFDKLHIGRIDEEEKNILLSSNEPLDTITNTIDTVTVIVIKEPIDTTPIPVLTETGIYTYGFYYEGASDEFMWDSYSTNKFNYALLEDEEKLDIQFNRQAADWTPIVLLLDSTVNLSRQAELELKLNNISNQDVKIWFRLVDINGDAADYLYELESSENNYAWEYESAYILRDSGLNTINMDLTNSVGFEYGFDEIKKNDLKHIKEIHLTILNPEIDLDNYLPLAIENIHLEVHSLRIGNLGFDNNTELANGSASSQYDFLNTVYGCMDENAINFSSSANTENGSCEYSPTVENISGCLDETALNYNASVSIADNSCIYEQVSLINIPIPVQLGQVSLDTITLSQQINCELDYNRIIDSVNVSPTLSVNGSSIILDISLFQNGVEYIIITEIEETSLNNDKVLIFDLQCSNPTARTSELNKINIISHLIINSELVTHINNSFDSNTINIFPNPTDNFISISSNELQSVSILSMEGKILLKGDVSNENRMDISSLHNGMYLIKVDGKQQTIPLIKN